VQPSSFICAVVVLSIVLIYLICATIKLATALTISSLLAFCSSLSAVLSLRSVYQLSLIINAQMFEKPKMLFPSSFLCKEYMVAIAFHQLALQMLSRIAICICTVIGYVYKLHLDDASIQSHNLLKASSITRFSGRPETTPSADHSDPVYPTNVSTM